MSKPSSAASAPATLPSSAPSKHSSVSPDQCTSLSTDEIKTKIKADVAVQVSEAMNKVSNSPDSSNSNCLNLQGSSCVGERLDRLPQVALEVQTPGHPGKPHATKVSHNSLVLSWGKPQYGADIVQSYIITYHAMDDPPGRSHTQTASQPERTELTNLAAKTTYLFKVRADSATGVSGSYSETSDPIETKCLHLADGLLEMPCLGRPFQLGTLYDCRNDSLIPGMTLWGPDTLGTAICKPMECSDFEVITEDSLNEKTRRLDVSAGLKLSVLSGLVKAGGSGQFLYDHTTSKHQVRISLRYKATSKFEQLNMSQLGHGKVEYPQVFEDDIATHVVTGVQYGADVIFVFDRQVDSQQDFRKVHGNMEAMIKVLPSIGIDAGASADLGIKDKVETCQCKFYGDLILSMNPTTYQDAVKVYQELPKLLGGAGYPNSVPKKVWLYSLGKLDSRVQRMVCDISSYLIDDLQEIMESLHELEVQINDLIRNEVCVYFVGIRGGLEKSKRLIGGYKTKIMKSLSTLLPKVRGGREEETKLAELLEMNRKSPFSCDHVSSWIKEKETEVSTLAVYLEELQKHQIQLAFQSDEMVRLTSGLAGDSVLCFDFNIPAGKDAQLQRMENCLHSRRVDQELQLQSPWYKSQELRQQLQRFVSVVTRNRKDSTCKYVVTNGYGSKSSKVGAMVVFVDACPTDFEPPDQPGVPHASNKTHNSLQLSWSKPKYGSDSVQSYTVSYHSVDDPPDQWSTQTSSEECLVLTKLTPGSLYHFKVTAESVIGSSPESEVGEERLPPDQPGKPETTMKTCNSLQLKWAKPAAYGASIVNSYTIHYRSVDGPPDQWSTQTSSEECLVLTKLTPGSLYHFKVTAESAVGSGPESRVGKERLPPDQPGKPQVTQKSHNSVQLLWEKPKHGAHIVQSYVFFYCFENEPDKWQSQQTNKQNISLSGLTPGVMYCFKVIAQSVAGSSPASEVSEVRLPPDQPGKPHAANKTHNSLNIQWAKPKHGAHIVSSYTVSYCSMDDHANKWFTITKQCLVLTKLTPGSLYHIKVTAESAVGSSPASEVSEVRLPPDQPGKPETTMKNHNSLQIKWTEPEHGAHIVSSYTVSYRFVDDHVNKWFKKTITDKCLVLTKLTPGSLYRIKVTAESSAGSSPESEVGEERLKPDQPGKPEAVIKTHNSLQLKWVKPEHGANIVSSYTVDYRSVDDPPDQWCTQTTSEECLVLTKLTPGSLYHFKVTAESAVGSSLASEVGEERLPPDQPGKPNGSCATYNSVQLKWTQPQHGAETVQYYTISYQSLDSQCQSLKTTSKHECVTLGKLAAKTVYTFKVRAESAAGPGPESELSDPIKTLTPSLGKPHVSNVSYYSVQLSWEKPSACVQVYTVLCWFVKDDGHPHTNPAGQWHAGQVFSSIYCSAQLDGLLPNKTYVFKVKGETYEGACSPESEVSDPIVTKPCIKPWGARLLSYCKRISADVNPRVYQLPLQYTMNRKGIAKVAVGEHLPAPSAAAVPHKVLMLFGATGAGKSTLINGIANYIMGVDWEDEYRFKLISEETAHDRSKSQTKCITAYTFHKDRGSPLPYTLTVIDTPGFGDTRGLERDREIIAQIKKLFSIQGDEGIDQLHGIGFVTSASQPRLTLTQRYVFDSILSVFGKDVADNIFLMVTFADGKRPPILDAARTAGIPFKNDFKFNNSALFASKETDDVFDKMFWEMCKINYGDFFDHLATTKPTSLNLSKEVLQQREQLEIMIHRLLPLIQAGLAKIGELQQNKQLLREHETDIMVNRQFTRTNTILKQRKIDLPKGHYTLICPTCDFTTCDNDYPYSDDEKYKSSAMNNRGSLNATCKVCPKKCSWEYHHSRSHRFEEYQEMETQTIDMFKAKYDSAMTRRGRVETMLRKMEKELEEIHKAVLQNIKQAKQNLQRLQEVALRPSHLTMVEYIDMIIESEKKDACPGWRERVKALREVRKQAEILSVVAEQEESKNPFF